MLPDIRTCIRLKYCSLHCSCSLQAYTVKQVLFLDYILFNLFIEVLQSTQCHRLTSKSDVQQAFTCHSATIARFAGSGLLSLRPSFSHWLIKKFIALCWNFLFDCVISFRISNARNFGCCGEYDFRYTRVHPS